MSGLWSRGYNGDCRDCVYYDCLNWCRREDNGDEIYYCSLSGEYFSDQYGRQCHCFYDKAEQKKKEEESERKDKALAGVILADGFIRGSQSSGECSSNSSSSFGSFLGWFAVIVVGSVITVAEKQINHALFWPLGSWLIAYLVATVISVVANKKANRITLVYLPLILTIIFMIIMSLVTGNNYFSIWLYQPELDAYKRFHMFK